MASLILVSQLDNFSFDVTPAKLISGIVTEKGVILPDADGKLDVKAFVASKS